MPLQIRRGTEAQRLALTSTNGLVVGELLYVTDDQKLYVGNGTTPGGVVATGYTNNDAKDAAAASLTGGTHQSITFTYNSVAKTISSTLNLSDYQGTIKASSFKGSVLTDDGSTINGVTLVDAISGSINLNGTVKDNIIPSQNLSFDIGSASLRFRDLYLSGSTIYLGSATISSIGSAVDLPLGSTMGGVPLSGGGGADYSGNIIADDSTVMVNTATKVITAGGGFIGNLNGNVTGDVSGNVTGNVTGNLSGNVTGNVTGNLNGITNGLHIGEVRGSVFGDNSSVIIDGTSNMVLADVDNTTTTSDTVNAVTLTTDRVLSNIAIFEGTTGTGEKAGIRIVTDGDLNDPYDLLSIFGHKSTADGMASVFYRTRGTPSSPTPLQNGDAVMSLTWAGADSLSAFSLMGNINMTVDGAPTPGYIPSRMNFNMWTGSTFATALSFDSTTRLLSVANNTIAAGGATGQVNLGGGVVTYLKINVGGTDYALPLYGINP